MTSSTETPPQLRWNRSGWFGSQIGATAWMFGIGLFMLAKGEIAAAVTGLGFGALANAVGTWLWSRRQTRAPYPALQQLIGTSFACSAAVVLIIKQLDVATLPTGGLHPSILLVYPAIMLMFHCQLRAFRQ